MRAIAKAAGLWAFGRAPGGAALYTINGYDYSHLAILPEIESLL